MGNARRTNADLVEENAVLQGEIDRLTEMRDSAFEGLAVKKQAADVAENRARALESENSELSLKVTELQGSVEHWKKKCEEVEQEHRDALEQRDNARRALHDALSNLLK